MTLAGHGIIRNEKKSDKNNVSTIFHLPRDHSPSGGKTGGRGHTQSVVI